MKRLPENFRMNVLLPGAVWLLASVLIGRYAVIRMEPDTITFVLFLVITLVVFAIPVTVYMEYRGKIEEYFSRHRSRRATCVGDSRKTDEEPDNATKPAGLPQDFPDALKGEKVIALLDALHREGFLDKEYRPCKGCNATQMAFIADSIAAICNISYQWKTFGNYWQLPNMRQLLGAKDRRGSKMEKEDVIVDVLKRTAEADEGICNTDAYRRWLKNARNRS